MRVRVPPPAGARGSTGPEGLSTRAILAFWLPLAATWLMMSVEGPYLSAIVARLAAPVPNLAAFGVAFTLAWLAESPIIMLLTATTALVKDRASFLAFRRFATLLNGAVTATLVVLVLPPVFRFVSERLLALPPDVARLAHLATALLVPWPAAIGYRRFYQGVLVRHRMTRRVAYGTVVRLATMSATAAALATATPLPGALIAAVALSAGVVAEAGASRFMARRLVAGLIAESGDAVPPSQRELARFYFPLALTSMISMTTAPLLTFFMSHGPNAVQSLAAWPVVSALVFLFRSGGVGYQETSVALSGEAGENVPAVRRTAALLGAGASLLLAAVAFSPLLALWFRVVVGLGPELIPVAVVPTRILVLLPALEYALSFLRSRWVLAHQTRPVTLATALEVGALLSAMAILVVVAKLPGTIAAALALLLGRLASCAFLVGLGRTAWARRASAPVVS
ncbi:MAG: hypothetical protein ACYDBY_00580 [Thermoanaerobaculia bacterium]